jgi:hypothetical protein
MLLAFVDVPQRTGRLTVFPVVSSDEPQFSYLLLTDALRRGVLIIERNQPDEPPHLIARNRGSQPVLILDCETMMGGQESQATNQSVLLGPGSVTKVPVSCRESGKWNCREIEDRFAPLLDGFPLLDDQVGVLAFLDQHLLGLDVLGSPELYAPVHRRLLASHLLTAFSAGKGGGVSRLAEEAELQALATALQYARRETAPCLGRGEYSTLHGAVTGGELTHNGHLVHLSVFPSGTAA